MSKKNGITTSRYTELFAALSVPHTPTPPADPCITASLEYLATLQEYVESTGESAGPVEHDHTRMVTSLIIKLRMRLRDLQRRRSGQDIVAMTSGEAKNPGPKRNLEVGLYEHGAVVAGARAGGVDSNVAGTVLREAGKYVAKEAFNAGKALVRHKVREYFNGPAPVAVATTRRPPPTTKRPKTATSRPSTTTHRTTTHTTTAAATERPRATPKPKSAQPLPAIKNKAKKGTHAGKQLASAGSSSTTTGVIVRTAQTTLHMPKKTAEVGETASFDYPIYELIKGAEPDPDWINYGNALPSGAGVRIQAGTGELGKQIQSIAMNYVYCRVVRCEVEYEPNVGSNSNGEIFIVCDPTAMLAPPTSAKDVSETCAHFKTQPGVPGRFTLPPSFFNGGRGGWLKTRRTEYMDGSRAEYDHGAFWVFSQFTSGIAATQLIGRVHLHMTLQFKCLQRLALPRTITPKTQRLEMTLAGGSTAGVQYLQFDIMGRDLGFTKEVGTGTLELAPGVYRVDLRGAITGAVAFNTDGGVRANGSALANQAAFGAVTPWAIFSAEAPGTSNSNLIMNLSFLLEVDEESNNNQLSLETFCFTSGGVATTFASALSDHTLFGSTGLALFIERLDA